MNYLDELESRSIYIIREAYRQFKDIAALWSIGKDSILGDSELYYKIDGVLKRGTIEELYNSVTPKKVQKKGGKEIIFPKEEVEVLTVEGRLQREAIVKFGKVTALISHSTDKDIYNIRLSTNKNIKVTGDHSLVGAYSDKYGLRLKPIEARKITKNTKIFCPTTYNFDVDDLKEWENVEIEDWLLILAGLWIADGCYALDRKIIISTGNNSGVLNFLRFLPREKNVSEKIAKELNTNPAFNGKSLKMGYARQLGKKYDVSFWTAYDAKKRMSSLLNRPANLYVKIKKNGDVWLCSKALVSKLQKLGFKGTKNKKRIPDWIHKLSNRQIALFLSGYFAGDGSCWLKKDRPAYNLSSMNKELLEQTQFLFLRLGIGCGFSASCAKSSGFRTKNKNIYQITITSAKGVMNFQKLIPDLANKFIRDYKRWNAKIKYQISARKLREIKKLPCKRQKVYDLEVEKTHNFIANGIVCHNSTTLVWLCRKAFYGKIPFPVVHIDTSYKFKEIYEFRDKWAKEWGLKLIVGRNEEAIKAGVGPTTGSKLSCCSQLKTDALKQTIAKHGFKALLLGIRRDEHGIRAKERYISPRTKDFKWNYKDQPPELWDQFKSKQADEDHVRVHPLLHWTEFDIWAYVQREGIPVVDLYFAKDGKRYRSIGCATCCNPIPSNADTVKKIVEELRTTKIAERSGRAQDKESAYVMQKLRSLGYM